ncbi:hypothetical protein KCP76_15325 [Salmonella enterica subsp. enterica serovar Weltevreden]|nr:hypothetical protein KCP76_15325 [Salmonella enterica subsp. enterica serovar Weltevreden]
MTGHDMNAVHIRGSLPGGGAILFPALIARVALPGRFNETPLALRRW